MDISISLNILQFAQQTAIFLDFMRALVLFHCAHFDQGIGKRNQYTLTRLCMFECIHVVQ